MAKILTTRGYREGRGFSLGELKAAGVLPALARSLKITVDARRKTTHDFNIKELTEIASKLKPEKKNLPKRKKKEVAPESKPVEPEKKKEEVVPKKKTTRPKKSKGESSTAPKAKGKK